jgi:hypothetical protein
MLFPDFLYKKYSYYLDIKHRQKLNKTLHGYKDSRRIRDSGKLIRKQIEREIYAYHVYSTALKSSQKIITKMIREGILDINLTKDSSILFFCSQALLLADLKYNHPLLFFKSP